MTAVRKPFYTSDGCVGYYYADFRDKDRRTILPKTTFAYPSLLPIFLAEFPVDLQAKIELERELKRRGLAFSPDFANQVLRRNPNYLRDFISEIYVKETARFMPRVQINKT